VLIIAAAVLGALAGPLLALPAYRLSVPQGYLTACATCDRGLGWRPVARCPGCRHRFGPRTWLLAAVSAAACAAIAWALGPQPELVVLLPVVLLGVLLGAVDLAAERLPDILVLPGLGAIVAAFAVIAGLTGAWPSWARSLATGLAYAAGYFVIALLPGGQLGLGDVKLAALLGVVLGWFGWPLVLAGVLLPWLVNAPVAVVLLVRRGRGSMPFGPAMLAGAYLAVVLLVPLRP
jgi:leader peptidase (prepilin peptidase)/N-methyltransferase